MLAALDAESCRLTDYGPRDEAAQAAGCYNRELVAAVAGNRRAQLFATLIHHEVDARSHGISYYAGLANAAEEFLGTYIGVNENPCTGRKSLCV